MHVASVLRVICQAYNVLHVTIVCAIEMLAVLEMLWNLHCTSVNNKQGTLGTFSHPNSDSPG